MEGEGVMKKAILIIFWLLQALLSVDAGILLNNPTFQGTAQSNLNMGTHSISGVTTLNASGLITAGSFSGDGSLLTNLTATNITGLIPFANLTPPDYVKMTLTFTPGDFFNDGGTFTSGSWQTGPLNLTDLDAGSHATLTSSHFVLGAGTYNLSWFLVGYRVDHFQSRIRNTTNSVTLASSNVGYSNHTTGENELTMGHIQITTDGTKTYELQGECETTETTDGFGKSHDFGEANVHEEVILIKIQ